MKVRAVRATILAVTALLLAGLVSLTPDRAQGASVQLEAADTLLFALGVDYFVGSGNDLRTIAGSDFDGDGAVDLLVGGNTSIRVQGILLLLKNSGNGTFTVDTVPQSKPGVVSIFAADFDGDGYVDAAVTGGGVTILKNNGNATFLRWADYPLDFWDITGADLNGDGNVDLVGTTGGKHSIIILKNKGDGTFSETVGYDSALGGRITAADLDGDGAIDLAVAGDKITILRNNGDGTFTTRTDYDIPKPASSILAADLDGDGYLDLAVTHAYHQSPPWPPIDSGISVLKNNGDGTFGPAVEYTTGREPWNIVAGDWDGDGDMDLATANHSDSTVSVLLNNGDGTFGNRSDYRAPGPSALYAGDLDRDGDKDLATANFAYFGSPNFEKLTVSIFLNQTNTGCPEKLGDLNHDCLLTLGDVVLEMDCVFLFYGDCRLVLSDLNCDGVLSASDLVLELNAVYLGLPMPC